MKTGLIFTLFIPLIFWIHPAHSQDADTASHPRDAVEAYGNFLWHLKAFGIYDPPPTFPYMVYGFYTSVVNFLSRTTPANKNIKPLTRFIAVPNRHLTHLDTFHEGRIKYFRQNHIQDSVVYYKKLITAKDIDHYSVGNVLSVVQGKIAGLDIMQGNGLPGADFNTVIRGANSIKLNGDPLYIIDGAPLPSATLAWQFSPGAGLGANGPISPLSVINVKDIDTIEVLKDADATAIYGYRGGNGVVLITTKKGDVEPIKANVNVYSGIGRASHLMTFMNTQEYLEMRKKAFENDGAIPGQNDHDVNGNWDTNRYTNWQKKMIGGTAFITDAQINTTGGSVSETMGTLKYLLGFDYRRETTIYPGNFDYYGNSLQKLERGDFFNRKASFRTAISFISPNGKTSAMFNASYISDITTLPSTDLTVFSTMPPNTPEIFTQNGDTTSINWQGGTFYNPYGNMLKKYKSKLSNLAASASFTKEVTRSLNLKAIFSYNEAGLDEIQPNLISSMNPKDIVLNNPDTYGYTYFVNNKVATFTFQPVVTYNKRIGEGEVCATGGFNYLHEKRDQGGWRATGYLTDQSSEEFIVASKRSPLGYTNLLDQVWSSFLNINYTLLGKYSLTLNGRRDATHRQQLDSTFAPYKRKANFGSVGANWYFAKENFAYNILPFLSYGKFHVSAGVAGNDQPTDFRNVTLYGLHERTRKMDATVEFGFMDNHLLFSTSYYRNKTVNKPVGYIIRNTGVEFELWTTYKGSKLTWTTAFNVSIPSNKLLVWEGLDTTGTDRFVYSTNQPLTVFKGFQFNSVDSATGLYKFHDFNNDGLITFPDDYNYTKPIGTSFYGGFQNTFSYRGWNLSFLLHFVKQTGYYYPYSLPMPGTAINQPANVTDQMGPYTQDQSSPAGISYTLGRYSDKIIADASYVRLKNVSISYDFPADWQQRLHLKGGRLYLHGQNLLTVTRYEGIDPETAVNTSLVYPPLRVWTLGAQLTF